MIGKTDVKNIISLLNRSQFLIEANCQKACDLDVARRCRNMKSKLERRLNDRSRLRIHTGP